MPIFARSGILPRGVRASSQRVSTPSGRKLSGGCTTKTKTALFRDVLCLPSALGALLQVTRGLAGIVAARLSQGGVRPGALKQPGFQVAAGMVGRAQHPPGQGIMPLASLYI